MSILPLNRLVPAIVMLPQCGVAVAQQQDIVVTGSRTGISAEAYGGTFVNLDDRAPTDSASLAPVLNELPGVRAFDKGGAAGSTYLSIEGSEPNHTLVLLNGVRLNDPTNSQGGSFDLSQVDPAVIGSLSVVQGGMSAVYGSDALAGVVDLRLRQPQPGQRLLSSHTFVDSSGAVGGNLSAIKGWEGGGILASGGATATEDLTPGSRLERRQGLLAFRHTVGTYAFSSFALVAHIDRLTFPEDSGGPMLAANRDRARQISDLNVFGIDLTRRDAKVSPHVMVSWTRQRVNANTPSILPGVYEGVPEIASDTRFDRFEATGDLRVSAGPSWTLAAGASFVRETAASRGFVDLGAILPADFRVGRHQFSQFAEISFRPSDVIDLTGSLRHDDSSNGSGTVTGRLAARLKPIVSGPELFGTLSKGFKLPSLYALYYPLIANPALRPERGTSLLIGARQSLGAVATMRIAYFGNRYINLIDFDPALFTNVNRSRVTSTGMEGEADLHLRGIHLRGSITYLKVRNAAGALPLRARPEIQYTGWATWQASHTLRIFGRIAGRGDVFDSSVPTGLVRLRGYTDVDAGLDMTVSRRVSVAATVMNVFDERYFEAVGFPEPRRHVQIGITARL